eukprot:Nitzschia sp. Nitz4//scaffold188_size43225//36181//37347//NITZ4_007350-RA/size43225-processed-gene-0.25-mRNA-1//1//CDS//3329539859//1705//frame0
MSVFVGSSKTVPRSSTPLLPRLLLAIAVVSISVNLLVFFPVDQSLQFPERSFHHKNSPNGNSTHSQSDVTAMTNEQGQEYIRSVFQLAGLNWTAELEAQLPSWTQVQQVIGSHPYVVGLDNCPVFREKVPPLERMLGAAGMFNTGTNLVTHLLKQNCEIPERRQAAGPHQSKEKYGMRWQVPWGKHTPAHFRDAHHTTKATDINKDYVLPVVTIRNPYTWYRSMCKNSYTAKWKHPRRQEFCPYIKDAQSDQSWNQVTVKYGAGEDSHQSLAHLWNDWYAGYIRESTKFPWIVVRMEDLVFYPVETTRLICECAGGKLRTDAPFAVMEGSAKADSPGHDTSTGIVAAWQKYSKPYQPKAGMSDLDYEASIATLDSTIMEAFGYQHPPP